MEVDLFTTEIQGSLIKTKQQKLVRFKIKHILSFRSQQTEHVDIHFNFVLHAVFSNRGYVWRSHITS